MWTEKFCGGVLRVLTPLGPRYLRPSFLQRIYLRWIFRNFQSLPVIVLSRLQLRFMRVLCAEHHFVSLPYASGLNDSPILGTLEQRPPIGEQEVPPRRPSSSVSEAVAPFATDVQQRS
jgi:hypothetical protein